MTVNLLLAAVLGLPGLAGAVPYVYPYNWMTGEDVVRKLLKVPESDLDFVERDMTHAYVNGLKDGTQGTVWCFAGAILPHELNLDIVAAIRKRSKAELEGNAAPLVLDVLRKRYPCKPAKGGRL